MAQCTGLTPLWGNPGLPNRLGAHKKSLARCQAEKGDELSSSPGDRGAFGRPEYEFPTNCEYRAGLALNQTVWPFVAMPGRSKAQVATDLQPSVGTLSAVIQPRNLIEFNIEFPQHAVGVDTSYFEMTSNIRDLYAAFD